MLAPGRTNPLSEDRRLRIAVLNRTFAPTGGGAERYAIALVEQLAARHEIHVFAQDLAHDWPGVAYHRVSKPFAKPRWVNQLWYATASWWATRRGFDVVHSHENTWHGQVQTVHVLPVWHSLFHGRLRLRRLLRWTKVVFSPRLWTYLALEQRRFANAACPPDGRGQRHIVVTSDSLRSVIAKTFPSTAPGLVVLSPGVDLPAAPVTPAQREAARRRLGLPPHAPCILLVGNDYRKKGLERTLHGLSLLSKEVVLAVVGSTLQRPHFQALAHGLGISDRVFFLGQLRDVTPAYQAADALAHPTLEDTFAMVVLEAMAHGLPVVVSSAQFCGITALLSDGVNALVLDDPLDAKALARALQRIVEEPALRELLGRKARAFAQAHGWAEKARQQEQLYFCLTGGSVAD
jgi:glycosyltransferase involved in cell wall biosynthesis